MSTFIWGKIKLNSLPKNFKSFNKKNISVFFEILKNDLFLSDLNDGEIYFNIACGYKELIYPFEYNMNYLNCSSQYFFTNNKDKNAILENDKDLQERIFNLQSILEEIYNKKEVSYIEFYNTDTGNESSIEEYKEVNWNITDFSKKFFEAMIQNSGFTPTIKVVFKK